VNSDPRIIEDARTYHEKHGAALGLPPFSQEPSRLALDKHLGKVTALAFDAMKHSPNDPEVRRAYEALKAETKAQYDHLVARGVKFTPWTREGQPYANSADMARDARENRHLWYFETKAGYGSDERFRDNPLLEQAPGHPKGVTYNDLFRCVHDWFAHAMHGHQFGPQGELRAWHEHAKMYSPEARKALTTETHGQNSWVNFGPHLRGDEGPLDKPFADQKAGVLPEDVRPTKLARAKDIRKLTDFWGFLNGHADDQDAETPGGENKFDRNRALVFADFLQDHDDARADLLRAATGHDFTTDRTPWAAGWYGFPAAREHPVLGGPLHPVEGVNLAWPDPQAVTANPAWAGPVYSHVDNAHTYVALRKQGRPNRETGAEEYAPVLHWQQYIPRTVSTTRKARVVHFTAPVTAEQLHAFIDKLPAQNRPKWRHAAEHNGWTRPPSEPTKLGRAVAVATGPGAANRQAGSDNHDERVRLAEQVLTEAGIRGQVRAVIHHEGSTARPSVAARVLHGGPQHALYAAAWMGLLTQQPSVVVFHPGDGGDTLHVLDSPHPSNHVASYLKGAGVKSFVTEDRGAGTRAYLLNPDADAATLARGLDASHTEHAGTANRIGADPGAGAPTGRATLAEARAGYRTVIRDAERAAGPEAG
jgi:hypothetical protein